MATDKYVSPLSERYASKEMQYIFSPDMKFKTWRRLWIALAEVEKELNLKDADGNPRITDAQIEELKSHMDDINYDVAKAREKEVRHVKTFVVDTINGIMVADEMRRSKDKGYDKWQDLAACIYGLVDYALTVRDDLNVIFICHTQTERDDSGYNYTRIKTSGKKLDKIVLESKFNTVLLAKCVDGHYVFETQSNFSSAKSPAGALELTEENDMAVILDKLKEY